VREALGPSGVLVNPRDPAALAKAIVRLISSPASRRQLGEAARARALRYFTEDKFVAEYRGSYLRLTDASHAVRPTDRPVIRPTFAAQTKAPYQGRSP
jgi:glycosyltransferase involved in cell wall biosynthesis